MAPKGKESPVPSKRQRNDRMGQKWSCARSKFPAVNMFTWSETNSHILQRWSLAGGRIGAYIDENNEDHPLRSCCSRRHEMEAWVIVVRFAACRFVVSTPRSMAGKQTPVSLEVTLLDVIMNKD